jgi:hypothetical protein
VIGCIIPSPEGLGYYRNKLVIGGFTYQPIYYFNVEIRIYAAVTLLRYPIAVIVGIGILTDLPSATPVGFA